MDKTHDENDGKAPDNAEFEADIAVEVAGQIAVIPPSRVEQGVKEPPGDELNSRRQGHSDEEEDEDIQPGLSSGPVSGEVQAARHPAQLVDDAENSEHAEAVDRADRSVQEASVYDLS